MSRVRWWYVLPVLGGVWMVLCAYCMSRFLAAVERIADGVEQLAEANP